MNSEQKDTAIIVAIILAVMMLFPPYEKSVSCGGYDFILSAHDYCTINIPRLLLQWFCVILVGGIVYLVQKNDNNNSNEK